MINRELIRIKTVQLLYSYLLVENPFSLESQPSSPTKEKRFAYSLYLDLLFLLTRVARKVDVRNGAPLADTRFIRNVEADDRIKSLKQKYAETAFPFAGAEADLAQKIKESTLYRNFVRAEERSGQEDNIWKEIFNLIVIPDPTVNAEIATRENYTLKGVDRMRNMVDTTFTNFFASADNVGDAVKVLRFSMDKTRELYFRLLALPIAITEMRRREIENAQFKLLKTADDVNQSTRFIDNEFVKFLLSDPDVKEGIEKFHIDWIAEDESLVRALLKVVVQCQAYKEYMEFPVTDFKNDCELWRDLYRYIIFLDPAFLEAMEDKSVFWNDDLDVIGTFIVKSVKKLANRGDDEKERHEYVLPMFKDEEDAEFGAKLFSEVIRRKDYYRELILSNIDSTQWEIERLAFMDSVILMVALAEIINFPKIPLTVSFNEYIEIAKYYSTPRSGVFINGLLGKIVGSLQSAGVIHKTF